MKRSKKPVEVADDGFVNQKQLAARLRVTDRRIRQLEETRIIGSNADGLYDPDLCAERYALYKSGSEAEWDHCFHRAELEALEADRLVKLALRDTSKLEEVTAASTAYQASMSTVRFLAGSKDKNEIHRKMMLHFFRREEDETLGGLLYRTCEILGSERGLSAEQIMDEVKRNDKSTAA